MSGWTVGDTTPDYTGACTTNGAVAVITGATIELHIERPDGTVVTRPGSVVSGAAGTWSAPINVGDLTVEGAYGVDVQVTYSGGKIQTFPADPFYVRAQRA